MNHPLVTIQCLVYNHEPFLRQCLDGFVMQQTNFPFEAIVHDDASTDGSAAIIREYAEKYPHIIKPIYETENQYSKKGGPLRRIMDNATRGKYVALCEGDDYWTAPHKLQKQVDFLESHPDYSTCFHLVRVIDHDSQKTLCMHPVNLRKRTLNLEDFYHHNWIQTNSVMYRWRFSLDSGEKYEDYVTKAIAPGDWMMHMLHAQIGKVHYDPTEMSVYRKHKGGVWANCGTSDHFYIKNGIAVQNFYIEAERLFGFDYNPRKQTELYNTIMACVATGNFELLAKLKILFPDTYQIIAQKLSMNNRGPWSDFAREYARHVEHNAWLRLLARATYKLFNH